MSTFNSATATVIKITFSGSPVDGPVSIPGLVVGDAVMKVMPEGFTSGYEPVITVNNQLQQSNGNLDWSSVTLTAYLLRGV